MYPKKPEITEEVNIKTIKEALHSLLESVIQKDLLDILYSKIKSLATKVNELKGVVSKQEEKIDKLTDELSRWKEGENNILFHSFTDQERQKLRDTFIGLLGEAKNDNIDHIQRAKTRVVNNLGLHENAAEAIAKLMDDMRDVAKGRLIPQEEVFLDPKKLSEDTKIKIKHVINEGGEKLLRLPEDSVRFDADKINLPGNHVLLDVGKMDNRHRKALEKTLAGRAGDYVSLPVVYLATTGEQIDKRHITRFPEEDTGERLEGQNPERYDGDSSTASEDNPNDGLPF